MPSSTVRLGVVGVGDFGARHARVAAALPEVELVAVADADAARRSAVGRELGVEAYRDVEELLEGQRLDAVVVATPQERHLADVAAAAGAGAAVLVEKPIVASADQLTELERIAVGAPLVMPAHVSRFLPAVAALRARLRARHVLAVRAIRVVPAARLGLHGHEHPALVAMVHDLDLARAFLPGDLVHVTSLRGWTDHGTAHPQLVTAQLLFDDGAIATVENHWTLPHTRQYIDARLEVVTPEETAYVTLPSAALRIVTPAGDEVPDVDLEATVAGLPVGALATQMRHFVRCVRTGTPSEVVSVQDAAWSVRAALTIAAQTNPG